MTKKEALGKLEELTDSIVIRNMCRIMFKEMCIDRIDDVKKINNEFISIIINDYTIELYEDHVELWQDYQNMEEYVEDSLCIFSTTHKVHGATTSAFVVDCALYKDEEDTDYGEDEYFLNMVVEK